MVRTTSWVPFHLASAQLNQPRFLRLSSYLLCSSPQTIWDLSLYVRWASHICEALLATSCFWKVRLASKRKAISLLQKISALLINARLWWHLAGLVLCYFYSWAGLTETELVFFIHLENFCPIFISMHDSSLLFSSFLQGKERQKRAALYCVSWCSGFNSSSSWAPTSTSKQMCIYGVTNLSNVKVA